MNRWRIWVLACLAICGCQTGDLPVAPVSEDPCPSLGPCDEPDSDAWLLPGPAPARVAALVADQPLFPGCPKTLQVMAQPHPIVFQAVRLDEQPDTAPDPSDLVCDPPEAPLQRAERRADHYFAAR